MKSKDIKIAHFMMDTGFSNSAYDLFERVVPGCSDYFLFPVPKKIRKIKFPVNFVNKFALINPFFSGTLSKYDFIILHSMNKFKQRLVSKHKGKYVWIGMGYDYYDIIYESPDLLLLEKTKEIAKYFKKERNRGIKELGKEIYFNNISKKETLQNVDFMAPVLENEYLTLSKIINGAMPKYVNWNYTGDITRIVDNLNCSKRVTANEILLGNNATLTNNHIEIFDILKKIQLKDKKIICPLSYGNNYYADYIEKRGQLLFKNNFMGMRNYLPYDQYIDHISSCSNVIMNHLRQQGFGIINTMLFLGAKIFLNKKNPIFRHYTYNGIKIYSINELCSNPSILDTPLSEKEVKKNRTIINKLYSTDSAIKKTHNLITEVANSS